MLAEVCVPEMYTQRMSLQGVWREDKPLQGWCSALEPKFSLGSTCKKFRRAPAQHVLEDSTFIVKHGFDTTFFDRGRQEPINGTWSWCVKKKTLVKTADEKYLSLQNFVESWEHEENQVIARKSQAHPSLNLLEFETFGCLRAGANLQLQRLLRAVGLRTLSFGNQGVIDLLQALLWQAGPPSCAEMPLTVTSWEAVHLKQLAALKPSEPWLRVAHAFLEDEELSRKLCDECFSLLEHTKDNWCSYCTLLFVVLIGQCVAEHSPNVAATAETLLLKSRQVGLRWLSEIQTTLVANLEASQMQVFRRKLVDISSIIALTFLPQGQVAVTRNSLSDWLTARAVQHDNSLLGKEQITHMDSWRKQLLTQAMKTSFRLETQIHDVCSDCQGKFISTFILKHWSDSGHGSIGSWTQCSKPSEWWYEARFSTGAATTTLLQLDVLKGGFLVDGKPIGRLPEKISLSDEYARLFRDAVFDVQPACGGGFKTSQILGACFKFQLCGDHVVISEEREVDGRRVLATLLPHKSFDGDLPFSLIQDYSHWIVQDTLMIYFRPVFFQDPGFELGCSQEGSLYMLNFRTSRIKETKTGFTLVDVRSETFSALFTVFGRLEESGRVHIFHRGKQNPVAILPRCGVQLQDSTEPCFFVRVDDDDALSTTHHRMYL